MVITSVTPLVSYGTTVATYAAQYKTQLAFAQSHPKVVQAATLYAPQLGYATKYAPEIAFLLKDGALVQQASKYPQGSVPAKLQAQLIAAAGGGTTGIKLLETLNTHQKEITSVIASAGALEAAAALRRAADGAVQDSAEHQRLPHGARYGCDQGKRRGRRPVEALVVRLPRRDHLLHPEHPADAGPLVAARGQAG